MECGQEPENVKVNYTQVPSAAQLARGEVLCPLSARCLISFLVHGLGSCFLRFLIPRTRETPEWRPEQGLS